MIDILQFQNEHQSDLRQRFEEEHSRQIKKLGDASRLLSTERAENGKLKAQLALQVVMQQEEKNISDLDLGVRLRREGASFNLVAVTIAKHELINNRRKKYCVFGANLHL